MREKNKKAFETLSKFRCGRARRLIFERLAYARLVPKKKVIAGPGWRRGKVDASRWQLRREGNLLISRQMLSTEFKVSLSVRRKQWSNSTLAKLKIHNDLGYASHVHASHQESLDTLSPLSSQVALSSSCSCTLSCFVDWNSLPDPIGSLYLVERIPMNFVRSTAWWHSLRVSWYFAVDILFSVLCSVRHSPIFCLLAFFFRARGLLESNGLGCDYTESQLIV